jgi:hypothetical protein
MPKPRTLQVSVGSGFVARVHEAVGRGVAVVDVVDDGAVVDEDVVVDEGTALAVVQAKQPRSYQRMGSYCPPWVADRR